MIRSKTPILTLAATALLTLSSLAMAGSGADKAKAQPEAFSTPLKLLKVYHEVGNAGGTAIPAATITQYGSTQTVNCTATAGCYVMVVAEAQVAPTASEASSAICLRVDGVSTDNCPFLTRVPTTGFTSFSHRGGVSVTTGTHTVTTHVYTSVASALHNFNTEVRLLKK
ncbi:hypothetical protein KAK07_14695 [Ideonella sp. 4Y16]|uniref:Uncharacterized protein n=1 Tax=Ideonella alba TaxID=2824118 RepID=A0A940Y496_9BURK|nr:hypothetical protein [Ideonella alba]MBQ0929482.1 hypothetical protein [Ideonella alba]MBQ0944584.1 hypothetical protein [Ideonella alba]